MNTEVNKAEAFRRADLTVRFKPAALGGGRLTDEQGMEARLVRFGHWNPDGHRNLDYAILVLKDPVDATPLEPDTQPFKSGNDLMSAGFYNDTEALNPQDRHDDSDLTYTIGCRGTKDNNRGLIKHYCNALGEASGQLLARVDIERDEQGRIKRFPNPKAVGIHVSSRVDRNRNRYIGAQPSEETENYAIPIEAVLPSVNDIIAQLDKPIEQIR